MKYFSVAEADKFALVRVSGDVLHDPEQTRKVATALAFLHRVGLVPVVVHGAGIFTGRRGVDVTRALEVLDASSDSDPEGPPKPGRRQRASAEAEAALEAGQKYLQAANAALVQELERAGIPAAAFPTGVFQCEPDDTYEGPMRGLVGRIVGGGGPDVEDEGVDDEEEEEEEEEGSEGGARTGGIRSALARKRVPVVASLGWTEEEEDEDEEEEERGEGGQSGEGLADRKRKTTRKLLTFPTSAAVGVLARAL